MRKHDIFTGEKQQETNILIREMTKESLTVTHNLPSWGFHHLEIFRPVCQILEIKC